MIDDETLKQLCGSTMSCCSYASFLTKSATWKLHSAYTSSGHWSGPRRGPSPSMVSALATAILICLIMMTRNVSRSAGVLLVLVYFGFVAGSYFVE